MGTQKLTCTAHVKLTISIKHEASWSADTTVSQIHAAAKREVVAAFTRLIQGSDLVIGIISDPVVSILSSEQEARNGHG
ncbi:MAG: hypothetical protein Q8S09_00375 [Hyphomonas sp.]|nr:hypothetical protein [Hyphomonas sp.]